MKFNRAVAVMMAASVVMFQSGGSVFAQSPATPDQMVAALKKNLGESQKRLRQYEWIETTVISLKGEEKSRKQQRVFYGADGKLTKLPIGEPQSQAEQGGRGRRGGRLKEKIVEKKKDEMQDYMERASALIHQYVPPSPDQVPTAKDAGTMKLSPPQQGKVRMEFPNFLLPSDLLSIDVDAAASRLEVVSVAKLSGQARGGGDAGCPVWYAARRDQLHGSDHAGRKGQEHPCGHREFWSPLTGAVILIRRSVWIQ
ncbi:MAG TPA: hypothetical protein VH702_17310 [Vicinamibacterales bacterium]